MAMPSCRTSLRRVRAKIRLLPGTLYSTIKSLLADRLVEEMTPRATLAQREATLLPRDRVWAEAR